MERTWGLYLLGSPGAEVQRPLVGLRGGWGARETKHKQSHMDNKVDETTHGSKDPKPVTGAPTDPPPQAGGSLGAPNARATRPRGHQKRGSGAQQRRRQRERRLLETQEASGSRSTSGVSSTPNAPRKSPVEGDLRGSKRHRSDLSSEDSPRGNPRKRPQTRPIPAAKTGHTVPYSAVTDGHLRVAVIDKQDWNSDSLGRLSVTQVERLEGELTKRLDLALAGGGAPVSPRSSGPGSTRRVF